MVSDQQLKMINLIYLYEIKSPGGMVAHLNCSKLVSNHTEKTGLVTDEHWILVLFV